MKAKDTLNMRWFPKVVQSDCRAIRKIYPLKQKQVSGIYEVVKNRPEVRRVFIFGSSVTGRCHVGSDLDICIDADVSDGMRIYDLQSKIGTICDWNCDILMYNNIGQKLKNTIEQEGVVIYE